MVEPNTSEPTNVGTKRVVYISSDDYLKSCDQLPKIIQRASMTHSLIEAYGLTKYMTQLVPRGAAEGDLALFHSAEYLECLSNLSQQEDIEKYDEEAEAYGLTYDCPAFHGVLEYASLVVGASILAAKALLRGTANIAINWPGGWHHAKRDEASGFCYLNDIVIAILKLKEKYDRVLYVDIDLHHGDGVEDAMFATPKVMTVSFHKRSPGFFPGSGDISSIGMGRGKYYTVNVPVRDGATDATYCDLFKRVMGEVRGAFRPQVLVCQCGADGLAGDPMGCFNLTPQAHATCLQHLASWGLPLLMLGGGGYHLANTSRCWAHLTAAVLGRTLSTEIPEHEFFPEYGPDYELTVDTGNQKDQNTPEYVDSIVQAITDNLQHIK